MKMYKILALSYIVAVYLANCQVPRKKYLSTEVPSNYSPMPCLTCASVQPNGTCANKPGICINKRNELCYNRMVSWNYIVLFVERGCTSNCRRVQENSNYRNVTYCCRGKSKCNNVNIWKNPKSTK